MKVTKAAEIALGYHHKGSNPPTDAPLAVLAATTVIKREGSVCEARMAAADAGAEDDRSNAQKLVDLEVILTNCHENPGATKAFDAMYSQFGLPGIMALWNANIKTPSKLWDFYKKNHQSVNNMAQALNLK